MTKHMNRILTLILIITIFLIGGVTLATSAREMGYAAFVTYTQYSQPDANVFQNIRARIQSLDNSINARLLGKNFFQRMNVQLQLAIGKSMLSYGESIMVKLKTGQLYDLQSDANVSKDIEKMQALYQTLEEQGIPMLFVYMHSEIYEEGMLPDGVTDYNNKVADDIVSGLRSAGIPTIDSREVKAAQGLTLDETVYRTDQHCATPMNFALYGEIVKALNGSFGFQLDEALTGIEQYDVRTLAGKHMGGVGERIGPDYVEPDDFVIMTPKYPTDIRRGISSKAGVIETAGPFEQAVMNFEVLGNIEDDRYANIYDLYGYHTDQVYYTNESAPPSRILVVKDSFGTPVASMLSLSVREELAIDLRKTQRSVTDFVGEFKPDAVVIIHCQEMMRGKNYMFVDQ